MIVVSVIVLAISAVVGFVRAGRRSAVAARAEASVGGKAPPLLEAGDVVLTGIVRHLADHDIAVKVSITQDGDETESSGRWSHSWTEVDREIVVAPFLLELSGGELVRVEPPRNVDVADALDQKVWINRNKRVLSAELVPGEQIHVRGRLGRSDIAVPSTAYREVAWGWSLTGATAQMLLSSEPLGAGLRQRAGFHRNFAWLALGMLVASQLSLAWFYQRAAGTPQAVKVTDTRYYTTSDSDGTYHHHVIRLEIGADVKIHGDDYNVIQVGNLVAIRLAGASNWNLGSRPTIHWAHGVFVSALPIVFWGLYVTRRRSSRPWFRRTVNEVGSGPLPNAG